MMRGAKKNNNNNNNNRIRERHRAGLVCLDFEKAFDTYSRQASTVPKNDQNGYSAILDRTSKDLVNRQEVRG